MLLIVYSVLICGLWRLAIFEGDNKDKSFEEAVRAAVAAGVVGVVIMVEPTKNAEGGIAPGLLG